MSSLHPSRLQTFFMIMENTNEINGECGNLITTGWVIIYDAIVIQRRHQWRVGRSPGWGVGGAGSNSATGQVYGYDYWTFVYLLSIWQLTADWVKKLIRLRKSRNNKVGCSKSNFRELAVLFYSCDCHTSTWDSDNYAKSTPKSSNQKCWQRWTLRMEMIAFGSVQQTKLINHDNYVSDYNLKHLQGSEGLSKEIRDTSRETIVTVPNLNHVID